MRSKLAARVLLWPNSEIIVVRERHKVLQPGFKSNLSEPQN